MPEPHPMRHWWIGTTAALAGVATVRLLSPTVGMPWRPWLWLGGATLAISGLLVIALGTSSQVKRRLQSADSLNDTSTR